MSIAPSIARRIWRIVKRVELRRGHFAGVSKREASSPAGQLEMEAADGECDLEVSRCTVAWIVNLVNIYLMRYRFEQ